MIDLVKRYLFRRFRQSEIKYHELNYLFWECTTRCNLNCLHCGSDCSKNSRHTDMPIADFLNAIETIENPPRNFTVVFTGGEPLLRSDIETCGMELRRRGFRWSIVSNGYAYTPERHLSLLNAGLGALTLSLDGLRESHNWLRNNQKSFDSVMNAIGLAASSSRLNFDIVTCVNQRNYTELNQIKNLLVSYKVEAWRLFTIIPIGRAASNPELMLTNNQFKGLMDFIAQQRKSGDIEIKFSCEGYVGKYESLVRDSYFFCRAGINIGSILIDGSISACPNIDRSFSQGNIYSDNFYEVWQNGFKPFRNREWTRKGQCSTCKEYSDCQGNGFHNWHGDKKNVLVCHYQKINAVTNI
ncbi:MAG TPA: TIGR04133 family radical SAM/SPASM protein [Prolixibacteraceae bacterium]|nr:TIGR04133 family radical SAM/SPASM protein [Prolixibacteraceae bacterium]